MSNAPYKDADGSAATGFAGRFARLISDFCPNVSGVGRRVGLLFAILCFIKLVMLVGLRKYLFEEHWRVGGEPTNWINTIAFVGFALLVAANLWVFGERCQKIDRRAVYYGNGLVLLLGALFIFLTFHVADKNYLYPVMHGTLRWQDLGSYLSLDFFFRWPFIAGWVLVYALILYGLIRTKRGHLILQITAVFSGSYILLCMSDLKEYRDALIGTDCLGIACLAAGGIGKRALKFVWLCVPVACLVFGYLLFRDLDDDLLSPTLEFMVLAGGSIVLFVGITLLAWKIGFYPAWSWLLPFAFFGFLLLVNNNYPLAPNYNHLLCQSLWLPRYFLGEFGLAAVLFFAAVGYRKIHPRGSLLWLDAVNLILILLALIDFRLSQIMGVRLDFQVLQFGDSPKMMWRMARPYLPSVFALLAGMIVLYASALWLTGCWRSVKAKAGGMHFMPEVIFLLVSCVFLGLTGNRMVSHDKAEGQTVFLLAETSPLWKRSSGKAMDLDSFTRTMRELGMGQPGVAVAAPPGRLRRDLNVVLIFQESSYNKYLSLFDGTEQTQPLLSEYKDRMELFPNFFCNFASSIHARFAAFAGLYPVADFHAFTLQHVAVKSIFEALHDEGYACSLFYSSFFDYTAFRDFLRGRGLDEMYDADTLPGQRKTEPVSWGVREEETLTAIQERIKKYATDHQRFFLTYIPAAPHYPYDAAPDRFRKYKMTEYQNFEPVYLNEMLYMDWVITSILDELKASGLLEKTLVVITADHGEMLGINGGPKGHGWSVTPELANIPLIIMDPGKPGYRINDTVGSEVDLLPTILDCLSLPIPEHQLYQGDSLLNTDLNTNRLIYLNSHREYGFVQGQQIICGDRQSESGMVNPPRKVFALANNGSRTVFTENRDANSMSLPAINSFDVFQDNFLRNYSRYCQMVWESPANGK